MSEAKLVLLESDDRMHPNTGEENFNESAYYNFYDPARRVGGFVRLGNRPNEKYAEMTACFFLPDGRVAFMFRRPEIASNAAHDAGGLRFEVVAPFREHHITYRGSCCVLADPLEMEDPKRAFTTNPHERVELDVRYVGLSAGWGGELRTPVDGEWTNRRAADAAPEFARGHFEQHGRALGTLEIGGRTFELDAPGVRDHSWGPRYWQAPKYYRWLTMSFGDDLGAVPNLTVMRDGREAPAGYVYRRGRDDDPITSVDVRTEFTGPQKLHDRIRVTFGTAGGERATVTGRVLSMIPLRNRRAGAVTRIAEGLTEWRWGERTGYGLSEYLDHLVE